MRQIRRYPIMWLVVAGVLMHAMLPFVHALAMGGSHGIATTLCSVAGTRTIYIDAGTPAPPRSSGLKWSCPLCAAGSFYAMLPDWELFSMTGGRWQHVLVASPAAFEGRPNLAVFFSSRAPPAV